MNMRVSANDFVCQCCGACCKVPGYVRLTEADVEAMAGELGLTEEAFIEAYTELSPTRSGLVLKGDPAAPCCFLTAEQAPAYKPQDLPRVKPQKLGTAPTPIGSSNCTATISARVLM